jgi:hypothetical protein
MLRRSYAEHGPLLIKPFDPKIVLEHIKRLLAARERQGGHGAATVKKP